MSKLQRRSQSQKALSKVITHTTKKVTVTRSFTQATEKGRSSTTTVSSTKQNCTTDSQKNQQKLIPSNKQTNKTPSSSKCLYLPFPLIVSVWYKHVCTRRLSTHLKHPSTIQFGIYLVIQLFVCFLKQGLTISQTGLKLIIAEDNLELIFLSLPPKFSITGRNSFCRPDLELRD